MGETYDLKVTSHGVITSGDVEVSTGKDVDGNGSKTKDTSEDSISLEGEDEVGDEGETPDDEVETDGVVVVRAGSTLGSVTGGRVRGSNAEGGKLNHAERKPEDAEERERVHLRGALVLSKHVAGRMQAYSEEVAHDPFEDSSETKEDGTGKKEDTNNTSKTASTSEAHEDHGEGKGRDDETSEAHRNSIGETLDVVAMTGSLGSEIKLLEKLW